MTITFEQTQDTTRGHNFMLRGIFQNSSAPQDNHGNIQIRTVSYNTTNPQDPQGDGAPSDFSHTAWVFAGHPVNSTPIAPNNTASTILHAYTLAKAGNQYIKSDDGFFNFGWHGPSAPAAMQHNVYQLTFSNDTEVSIGSAQGYPSIYVAGTATGPTQVLLMGGQTSPNSGETQAIWTMPKASKSPIAINPTVNTYLPALFTPTGTNIGATQGESQNWSENNNDKWYSNEGGDIFSGSFASGSGSRIMSDMRNPGNQSFGGPVLSVPANVGSSGEFSIHFVDGSIHPYHPLVSSVPNSQHELGFKLPFATAQATGGSVLYLPPDFYIKGRDMSPYGISNIAKGTPNEWRFDNGVASNAEAVWVHGGLYNFNTSFSQGYRKVGKVSFASMTSAVAAIGDSFQWGLRYTQGNSDAKTVFMADTGNSGSPEVNNWRTFNLQNSITTNTVGTSAAAGPGWFPAIRSGIGKVGGFAYIG